MSAKVIALYLPQFHRVTENDLWWGEGFTEWTSVQAAEKLFPGHDQPRIPLHQNYYDLLKKETMVWQAELMHRYGVDGMCFYHYYFKDGRKILERPAENLLRWKDVDLPFCFSWANESWVRSWSKLSSAAGNSWAARFDRRTETEAASGILLQQDYGTVEDWKAHYHYLSPFFHDARYLKYAGMPLFVIYKADMIPCLREMLACWEALAKEEGFPGLYVIGANVQDPAACGLKCSMLQEPADTFSRYFPEQYQNSDHVRKSLDYQAVWQRIVYKPVEEGQCLGSFVGYDDTPRQGHGGIVVRHRSPEVFEKGMRGLLAKAERVHAPYIFVNAWNEWGEGMYLEPDERFGEGFLQALWRARNEIETKENQRAIATEEVPEVSVLRDENRGLHMMCERFRGYWCVLDAWMRCMEQGKTLAGWLRTQGIHAIAVYGLGMLGKHVMTQLRQEQFFVSYGIDQQKEKNSDTLSVYALEEVLPPVELVIVTVMYDFDSICEKLKAKGLEHVLSLEEVVQRMEEA